MKCHGRMENLWCERYFTILEVRRTVLEDMLERASSVWGRNACSAVGLWNRCLDGASGRTNGARVVSPQPVTSRAICSMKAHGERGG
jgi:hypothetical protein